MPLVGFKPTKARLIIEDSKASVLVMKVVVYPGDSVKLGTGELLEQLAGVLRIRSKDNGARNGVRNGAKDFGSLVFIAESDLAADRSPAKYQINIAMSGAKFDTLVRIALSGRLPTKFFVDAGERISRAEAPGMGYEMRAGKRTKYWDTIAASHAAGHEFFVYPSHRRPGTAPATTRRCRTRPGVGSRDERTGRGAHRRPAGLSQRDEAHAVCADLHSRRACRRCRGHRAGALPARVGVLRAAACPQCNRLTKVDDEPTRFQGQDGGRHRWCRRHRPCRCAAPGRERSARCAVGPRPEGAR